MLKLKKKQVFVHYSKLFISEIDIIFLYSIHLLFNKTENFYNFKYPRSILAKKKFILYKIS